MKPLLNLYRHDKKVVCEIDGYLYAVYLSDPYHLWAKDSSKWNRIPAPSSMLDTHPHLYNIYRSIQMWTLLHIRGDQ